MFLLLKVFGMKTHILIWHLTNPGLTFLTNQTAFMLLLIEELEIAHTHTNTQPYIYFDIKITSGASLDPR